MSEAYPLVVPLVVDVKIGENWQEMTPVRAEG
jgi:DNA polymerase I-like protein with 3'-5' exonuclease and polymerase domains